MKRILICLLLCLNGCTTYSYRKTLMNNQNIEVTTHVRPFDYRDSDITIRWNWDIVR